MYYKGLFANNTATDKSGKNFIYDISQEFIMDIIKDKEYKNVLKWTIRE